MRAIQAGILVCLVAITGLLAAIYQQQADTRIGSAASAFPETGPLETGPLAVEPVELAKFAAVEAPPPVESKPAPVIRRQRPAAEPAQAPDKPDPRPTPKVAPVAVAGEAPKPLTHEPPPVLAEGPEPAEPSVVAETPPEFAEPLREDTPAKPREPRSVTLPAGQRLTVRLDNTLSTSRNRADDAFFVTLDEPIIVNGLIIADKGARLEGRVVESEQAGRVKGLARLSCELTRLHTDDGQRVEIETSTFALEGPRGRDEDLKKVAVGAGAGAILGAIFGGGKGAAIGAASGAGAGAGAAAATRGEPAVIEPETRLDFRLSEGVAITEKL